MLELAEIADVVIFVLQDKDADVYALVKRVGDQEVGLKTICHVLTKKSVRINTGNQFGGGQQGSDNQQSGRQRELPAAAVGSVKGRL